MKTHCVALWTSSARTFTGNVIIEDSATASSMLVKKLAGQTENFSAESGSVACSGITIGPLPDDKLTHTTRPALGQWCTLSRVCKSGIRPSSQNIMTNRPRILGHFPSFLMFSKSLQVGLVF